MAVEPRNQDLHEKGNSSSNKSFGLRFELLGDLEEDTVVDNFAQVVIKKIQSIPGQRYTPFTLAAQPMLRWSLTNKRK